MSSTTVFLQVMLLQMNYEPPYVTQWSGKTQQGNEFPDNPQGQYLCLLDLFRFISRNTTRIISIRIYQIYKGIYFAILPFYPSFSQFQFNYSLLSQTVWAQYRNANIIIAQNRSPRYNKLSEIEITGFIVFLASSNGTDINSEVERSLYLQLKIEKASLVYSRGDTNIYTRFLQRRTEESDIIGLLKSILN